MMKGQVNKAANVMRPFYDEAAAKAMVEQQKKLSFSKKRSRWISSVPLYIPFWFIEVEMDLRSPGKKGTISKRYLTMVNGMTNRGMLVRGEILLDRGETQGVFLESEVSREDMRETARLEALFNSKKLMNPPPHRVLSGERLAYYPMALVELERGGDKEVQIFDYYRGGIDRLMMKYLSLKQKKTGMLF